MSNPNGQKIEIPTHDQHGDSQFKPNTTVAAVIHCKGKFLLVEEIEHGKHVFNQPAGHLEANESLTAALSREVLEETGLSLSPQYLSGIYYFYREDIALHFLRFCFVIEIEETLKTQPQDSEIISSHWFTYPEIKQKAKQMRSPMVIECIDDYLSGKKIPLSALKTNL